MVKQLFIDTETTGVNVNAVGMYQLGGVIVAGRREEEFEFNCDIFEEDEVNTDAFENNGMSIEKISSFPSPEIVLGKFIDLMDKYVDRYDRRDKFVVIGYGSEFDQQILRNWFYKLDDDYFGSWFWHPWVCVMNLAMFACQVSRAEMQNFKLKTVAEHLEIPVVDEKLHTALYDAKLAREVYSKIVACLGI
ncbi:MAG: 3'-5' exonuclease [Sulfuricurvum sp.]|jgi:DNA polymerase-3 subunit epsilon|nr:3'-5' exonuclease [Sulfuricurvum sp.]